MLPLLSDGGDRVMNQLAMQDSDSVRGRRRRRSVCVFHDHELAGNIAIDDVSQGHSKLGTVAPVKGQWDAFLSLQWRCFKMRPCTQLFSQTGRKVISREGWISEHFNKHITTQQNLEV